MKTIDTFGTFKDAIAKSNPAARRLSTALRKLISKVYPDVVEVPWPKLKVIGYGVGPTKNTEHFCYIGVYGTHVNLGFNYGINLLDPNRLLEGTGKKFRHVKIMDLRDLKQPALKTLLQAAVAERRNALAKKG
jgi:hypothetical protein